MLGATSSLSSSSWSSKCLSGNRLRFEDDEYDNEDVEFALFHRRLADSADSSTIPPPTSSFPKHRFQGLTGVGIPRVESD